MSRVIASLTAVPPRFPYINAVLDSLLNQTHAPEAIYLNIPRNYRRASFNPYTLPKVPKGVTLNIIETDFGPASKILPMVQKYHGDDVHLFFCDDDKVYDKGCIARFLAASQKHPGCCITEEASDVRENTSIPFSGSLLPRYVRRKKNALYRLKRVFSLGQWKSRKASESGYADILEGWGGVMVRPEFFTESVYDIPDPIWMVDDFWLSGHLTVNSVPIWLNAEGPRVKGSKDEVTPIALRKQVVHGQDRQALNEACVRYFQNKYGIWGGTKR